MVGNTLSWVLAGLVRRTWLVVVVTVMVCAAFTAHAVAALVDARYLEPVSSPPLARPVRAAPVITPTPDGSAFVTRNMFCSTCGPSVLLGPGPTDSFSPAAELIATAVGTATFATVRVPATEVQGDWEVGDMIPGLGTVARIGFASIDLRDSDGRIGTLSLLPSAPTSGGRSEVGAATPDPAAANPYADRIRKIDDTTYEVERSVVRDLVSGSMQSAGARVLPVNKDGKLDGLRLIGVKPGGLANSLGLANSDVLQGVNNTKIESANTLLELYAQLDKLDTVSLDGTRRGKPLKLTLRLR
jgi:hypothetical protein